MGEAGGYGGAILDLELLCKVLIILCCGFPQFYSGKKITFTDRFKCNLKDYRVFRVVVLRACFSRKG